ncbi:DUF3343 domain-containing protein, partial [Dysosmobacter welbionis]
PGIDLRLLLGRGPALDIGNDHGGDDGSHKGSRRFNDGRNIHDVLLPLLHDFPVVGQHIRLACKPSHLHAGSAAECDSLV